MTPTRLHLNRIASRYNALIGILILLAVAMQLNPDTLTERGLVWVAYVLILFGLIGLRDGQRYFKSVAVYARHLVQVLLFIVSVEFVTAFVDYSQSADAAITILVSAFAAHIVNIFRHVRLVPCVAAAYAIGAVIGYLIRKMDLVDAEEISAGEANGWINALRENLATIGRHPLIALVLYRINTYYAFAWDSGQAATDCVLQCLYMLLILYVVLRILQTWGLLYDAADNRVINAMERIYQQHIDAVNVLFYIATGILFIITIARSVRLRELINGEPFNFIYLLAQGVIFIIALLRFWNSANRRMGLTRSVILSIGSMMWYLDGSSSLLLVCILVAAAEGVSARCILRMHVLTSIAVMTVAAWAAVNGYIYYNSSGGRLAMGDIFRTSYAAKWLFIMMTYRVLRRGRMRLSEYGIWTCVTLYVYHLAAGKTAIACGALFLGMSFLVDYLPDVWRPECVRSLIYRMGTILFPACALTAYVVSLTLGSCFNKATLQKESFWYTLASRFQFGYQGLTQYPIRLLSQEVSERGARPLATDYLTQYFYLDSDYLRCLVIYGLLFLIVILGIYVYIMIRCGRENNMILLLALGIVALNTFSEANLVDVTINILPVLAFAKWDWKLETTA